MKKKTYRTLCNHRYHEEHPTLATDLRGGTKAGAATGAAAISAAWRQNGKKWYLYGLILVTLWLCQNSY